MSVSTLIKKTRMECILSQDQFAKELGVTQITITRWETGKSTPNYSTMKRLLEYCRKRGVDTTDLYNEWKDNK